MSVDQSGEKPTQGEAMFDAVRDVGFALDNLDICLRKFVDLDEFYEDQPYVKTLCCAPARQKYRFNITITGGKYHVEGGALEGDETNASLRDRLASNGGKAESEQPKPSANPYK